MIQATDSGVVFSFYATPRASRTQIVGIHDGRLRVQIAAPPVDGKANQILTRWLAKTLGVRQSDIRIVGGDKGRQKRVAVDGLELAETVALVEELTGLGLSGG